MLSSSLLLDLGRCNTGHESAAVEFVWTVNAKEKAVIETLHLLTLEIIGVGKKKLYEEKWVKPRLNFKQLQEFKHAGDDPPTITPSYLGCK
ncbi:hypothetical protein Bca52824_028699 [Brassica carinata]|uniref:Cysteine proteinase inhibitor n=1 Tax=Brassica carinata TaxID=52824 RepID=A0A8X7VCY0_BRACI|nr:hypothetical protein Bca52824_028699 [Brassica carinata]